MSESFPAQVLLRMTDTSSTYLYWRWLDDPDNPQFIVLAKDTVEEIETLISSALIDGMDGETPEQAVQRAVLTGPFSTPQKEREWSTALSSLVLPAALATQILERADEGQSIVLRVLPSPRLSRVPWEILLLPDGSRVLENAVVRLDAPAVVNSKRGNLPTPWAEAQGGHTMYLLEPHVENAGDFKWVIGVPAADKIHEVLNQGVHREIDRSLFGQLLRGEEHGRASRFGLTSGEKPSRLVYYGHASSQPHEPGSAAIHLSDGPETYGVGEALGTFHRPFTALDLLSGTKDLYSLDPAMTYPHEKGMDGCEIWPMPPRVAIIACESGADHRALETFGMVMAMLNAGAELVTTTRWTLATDRAIRDVDASQRFTTTSLMLLVDKAHQEDDPVAEIREWQLEQLKHWQAGDGLHHTPLIWAALTTHVAPTQSPLTPEELQAARQ